MAILDWRRAAASDVAPLYARAQTRWQSALSWDARATWALVERARAAGTLPGFLIRDDAGAVAGWTYYLLHDRELQIGGVDAATAEQTATLVDAALASSEAAEADGVTLFAWSDAPGLHAHLAARGFLVERYEYLVATLPAPRSLEEGLGGSRAGQRWIASDVERVAALFHSAYPSDPGARPFVRDHSRSSWLTYVAQMIATDGCGRFLPHCSIIERDGERATAAAIVTSIGVETAHLAQIAVDPQSRTRGRGRALLDGVLRRSAAHGYRALTLLVSERNVAALGLYQGAGFSRVASFVSAVRDQPRRLTSEALETGGAITFR